MSPSVNSNETSSNPSAGHSTTGWNLADIFETITNTLPDALAQRQGDRTLTWLEFNTRANGVAAALLSAGLQEQDKVAQYLFNAPEYLESALACFKAGLAIVNTNYRYAADELVYLWTNADTAAVIFHGTFVPTIEAIRERLSGVRVWMWVDDGSHPCPQWAQPYEAAATSLTDAAPNTVAQWGRSGDHLVLLYTGGTTGMPKGVMWRQADLFGSLEAGNRTNLPAEQDLTALAAMLTKPGPRGCAAAPLMHGTGFFNALSVMIIGGSITTLTERNFDPITLLDTVAAYKLQSLSIVGDAFAKPILRALDAEPDRWDFSSMRVIVSSGVMWSQETKQGLLRHNPRLIMVDTLGSSEAIGMAVNTTRGGDAVDPGAAIATAQFTLGPRAKVLTEDGREVAPGSGELGRVALGGFMPIGYYKDPDKSAGTFQVVNGVRYSIPGDWAEILADGTVKLLGRGSQCINTGGEKVYPEEVEECLKTHPAVRDAAVVGLPDERFGEAITAIVELTPEIAVDLADQPTTSDVASEPRAALANDLTEHVKDRLARYKAPKRVLFVDSVGRAVNGKLDYRQLKDYALSQTAS